MSAKAQPTTGPKDNHAASANPASQDHASENVANSMSAKDKLVANFAKISGKIAASPLGKISDILKPAIQKAVAAGHSRNENRSLKQTVVLFSKGFLKGLSSLVFSLPNWILHGEAMTRISAIGLIASAFLLVKVTPRVPASVIALMQGKPSRQIVGSASQTPDHDISSKNSHASANGNHHQGAVHAVHSDKSEALIHPVYLGHLEAGQGFWVEAFVECSDASSAKRMRELLTQVQKSVVSELTLIAADKNEMTSRSPASEGEGALEKRIGRVVNGVLDRGRILRVIIARQGGNSTNDETIKTH